MKIPLWLIAVLFVGWSAFSINYWYCIKWGHCGGEKAVAEEPLNTSGEPLFRWNASEPEVDANFKKFKAALLKRGGQGDTLQIVGLYRAGEEKGPELAMARARELRDMMKPELPEDRVRLSTRSVVDSLSATSDPMPSAAFNWLKMVMKKEEGAIIESDNAITILFPFNSTIKEQDPKVDEYLRALVDKHKATNVTFSVVGHADNVDSDEKNLAFGKARAQAIAKIMTDYGIAANRIKVDSKGESEPVADNGTEDGRQQNRRVVITVNQ
jgi:outer membrane protein OmpA-like peptidoglycan-associated protein